MSEVFIIDGLDTSMKSDEEILRNYRDNAFHNLSQVTTQDVRVVRKLAQWTDPFTLPQTRLDCVKECSITPWDKFCCGWALRKRFMQVELFVEVRTATPQDIVKPLEDCLREAAIGAALAAIVAAVFTGGAAFEVAKATFISVLLECLKRKLSNIISVQLYTTSHWGSWN